MVAGEAFTPSDAARTVHGGRDKIDFIPGPVELGAALPLSVNEVAELYKTNESVSSADEAELCGVLPNAGSIPTADEFGGLVREVNALSAQDVRYRADLWDSQVDATNLEAIEAVSAKLRRVSEVIDGCDAWQRAAMLSGRYGGDHRKPWESLLAQIDETCNVVSSFQDAVIEHDPKLPDDFSLEEAHSVSKEIVAHIEQGGALSFFVLATRTSWKRFVRGSRVGSIEPKLPAHFSALHGIAAINWRRAQLVARWTRQMVPYGAPTPDVLGPTPEMAIRQFAGTIKKSLDWHRSHWEPLQSEAVSLGLRFTQLLEEQPVDVTGGELMRLSVLLSGPLQRVLSSRRNLIRLKSIENRLRELRRVVEGGGGDTQATHVVENLRRAITELNPSLYERAVARLSELVERRKNLERRRELLTKLSPVAPGWAEAIRERRSIHALAVPPAGILAAWLWRQFNDELDRRATVSIEALQQRSERVEKEIREVTAELIERRAWASQLRRTEKNLRQKQALVGWLDTVKKIGKGTGIRAPKLKAQANQLMSECRGAVPVWIMPLSRVAENFDPRTAQFDVVIVDEASQADVMGLLALYLAKKAVVVGDHEQVSPSAAGQDIGIVEHLIEEFLEGVPNRHLYDEKTSIYDLARQSFGGTIRLVEHFRCVPEIIQFSNQLSYEGAIRPLRDASGVSLKPHVIAHRVGGATSQGKENNEEAEEIAALVLAASEQPEYSDKTFGVISLVGDEQAYKIDLLLRKHLSEEDFKLEHNILCGNPAQFQGDERDVVFLSVVDTSDGGVLRLREEPMFKQRFNVAASRARDQMWVVHSLDPRSHLKPGDLRRRLIEYSEDPYAVLKALENVEAATESEFEKEVAGRLVRLGYRVIPQWRVGHYRIDLVVDGSGKRLAIECDGDKFHPIEHLVARF